ncbi:signal peptidase I [Kitasatospora kifunensis]|uniref:Signal peptidase I n=1 Tax=Kitasatospora kifunensis TaxID=58351 RepID=A0A7W7QX93_KITKI|nr:signal peptidase I [Kitasatospora kifunensis]MBB4921442.1 signal peptidase I [Kitasatospora kifunensis]
MPEDPRSTDAPPQAEAAAEAEAVPPEPGRARRKPRKPRPFWQELPILVGIALVLALVIKTFFLQAFSIPSPSMQNTLQPGDRILVDKLTPWFGAEPGRGEVVVFHDPGGWLEGPNKKQNVVQEALSFIGLMPSGDEKDLVKRVIAVGGDTVECRGTGPVLVNGKALDDNYIYPGNTPCSSDHPFGPIKVPKGRLWMMGDHRQDSADSRYHQDIDGGTVSVNQVVGRAIVVAWPVNRWATLPIPGTFQQNFASTAAGVAPPALAVAGVLPIAWRRRRRGARG